MSTLVWRADMFLSYKLSAETARFLALIYEWTASTFKGADCYPPIYRNFMAVTRILRDRLYAKLFPRLLGDRFVPSLSQRRGDQEVLRASPSGKAGDDATKAAIFRASGRINVSSVAARPRIASSWLS